MNSDNLSEYQLDLFLLRKELRDRVDEELLKKPKRKMQKRKSKPNSAWVMADMRAEDGSVTQIGTL